MTDKYLLLSRYALFFLPLLLLVIYGFSKRSFKYSMRGLIASLKEVGSGNLAFRVDRRRSEDGDFRQLYSAMDEMTERLINTITKITYCANNVDVMADQILLETDGLNRKAGEQRQISGDVNDFVDGLQSSIREMSEGIESLRISSSESASSIYELNESVLVVTRDLGSLKELVKVSISKVLEMSRYVNDVADNITTLNDHTGKSISYVGAIKSAAGAIESNAGKASELSEKALADSRNGVCVVEETVEGIEKSRNIVTSAARIMEEVGLRADNIGDVVRIINGIADRTKLLALNASIIASQAGEHGKSFAVVAEEIKKLSDMTTYSTGEIEEIVHDLQGWTGKGLDSMREGVVSIEESVAMARSAGKTLDKILESSKNTSDSTAAIIDATKEQSAASSNVLESMETIKRMIGRITAAAQKEAKGTEDVKSLMDSMNKLMESVSRAAEQQTDRSSVIAESSEVINEMLHYITEASERQHKRGEDIAGGVKKISDAASENVSSSEKLNGLVRPLKDLSGMLKEDVGRFRL